MRLGHQLVVIWALVFCATALALFVIIHFAAERFERQQMSLDAAESNSLYPGVKIQELASGKWHRPRAKLRGLVQKGHSEADGDYHFRLVDQDAFVVCEIIPEQPLPHPKNEATIEVWGIVRFDGVHDWWELHPVCGWK